MTESCNPSPTADNAAEPDTTARSPDSERPWFASWVVFAMAGIIALGFALATDRVWEDFYITYKSSKNLVAGKGLVFHEGEKVHTFTSPLGVLLPALCHGLTFGHSDKAALWLFRVLSAGAFAGAVTLLYQLAGRLRWPAAAAGLLALWLMVEPKTVDFSINGMETGLLVASVACILWALYGKPRRQWLRLGLAWGLMMWTRPDGFVYIAALSAGVWLFNDRQRSGRTRWEWGITFFKAGLVCTALYLPWFAWAWWYYGTPVPHTVIAKANAAGARDLWQALQTWLMLPLAMFKGLGSLDSVFAPSGHYMGGWPEGVLLGARLLAAAGVLVWLLPWARRETRAVSFAASLLIAYLGYFPGKTPAAWYMPGPAWLILFVLAALLAQVRASQNKVARISTAAVGWSLLLAFIWLLVDLTRLSKVEQVVVEDAHRREIGLWLREQAQPGDTMFMECLGYLGYFSELKTFDYPGMSSPEVVAASQKVGLAWDALIDELKPTWLVLRPVEAVAIARQRPDLLAGQYRQARLFDATPGIERKAVRGQGLLGYDAIFLVYQKQTP